MMLTEQSNPNTLNIDQLPALEIVQRINAEDRTVADRVALVLPQIGQAVDGIVSQLEKGGRLIYIGAGTSGRIGVLDAVECVPTYNTSPETIQAIIAGGDGAFVRAVEGAEDDRQAGADDLKTRNLAADDVVFGIAASGRTPYVLGAIDYASEIGALTIGLACNVPAPLLDVVDIPIGVAVGPEVIAGSTRMKAGTAQKMVLNMISTAVMVRRGKVYGNLMVDVQVTNEKLADRAASIVMRLTGLDKPAAHELLKRANYLAKVAVVMHHRQVDRETAEALLAANDGFLRRIIGDVLS
ncbi:MAG: N-acetylmuramic acid 6-phosphate etherase [Chloroflexota bacterium]